MSESAEVKRGLLGRTRPLLACTSRLRWLKSVCAPRHFDFTGRRGDRRSSCTRVRGRIEKSDEVRTTDSVIIHLIWPIEELDIRSMSL